MRIEGLEITYSHGGNVEWQAEWTDDEGLLRSEHGIVNVTAESEVLPAVVDAVEWVTEKVER